MVEVKKQRLEIQKTPSEWNPSPLCVYMCCSALTLPPPVLSLPITWLPQPLSDSSLSHTHASAFRSDFPSPHLLCCSVDIRASVFSVKDVPGIHVKWWKKKSCLIPAMTCGWRTSVQTKSMENMTVFVDWGSQSIHLGKDSQVQRKTRFLSGEWALCQVSSLCMNTNTCAVVFVMS